LLLFAAIRRMVCLQPHPRLRVVLQTDPPVKHPVSDALETGDRRRVSGGKSDSNARRRKSVVDAPETKTSGIGSSVSAKQGVENR
jgi:hypothetical protein